jgi:hypothetical protein
MTKSCLQSRRSRTSRRSLSAGWKSVRKSNPELWAKVLAKVKKYPGPWAAWKAMEADRLYKARGGRFVGLRA